MKNIVVVVGTRPEVIKCAPVIREMLGDPRFHAVVISTGQHRQMLDDAFAAFGITPDIDLAVMSDNQSLPEVTQRVLLGLNEHLIGLAPDAIMVHGDTATTLAGGIAGYLHQIPVIHIEAGLRSGLLLSPFPEEANRRLVAQISTLHLAPTPNNYANLVREGVDENRIVITGNTVVDALQWASSQDVGYGHPLLEDLDDDRRKIVVASAHHRDSLDMLPQIGRALSALATDPDVHIIVPLHLNPTVRNRLMPEIESVSNITIVDPMAYPSFCRLMRRAHILLSDSSGAEEEGPALNKPTLVLRDNSERAEAVASGAARLVGRSTDRIVEGARALLHDEVLHARMANAPNPYGDGAASVRIVGALAHHFGDGPPIAPFVPGLPAPEPVAA